MWPVLPFSSFPHFPSPTIWPWDHFCQRVGLGDGKSSPPSFSLIPWGLANIRGPFDISPLLATNQKLHLGGNLLWLKECFFPPSMETFAFLSPFCRPDLSSTLSHKGEHRNIFSTFKYRLMTLQQNSSDGNILIWLKFIPYNKKAEQKWIFQIPIYHLE